MADNGKRRILLVLGSPQNQAMFDVSLVYSHEDDLPSRDSFHYLFAVVFVDQTWAFPTSLKDFGTEGEGPEARLGLLEAMERMRSLEPHLIQSHLMCREGQCVYRSLLQSLGVPIMGSPHAALVVGQDKGLQRQTLQRFMARGTVVRRASAREQVARWDSFPCVVKAADLDNSVGLSKVQAADELADAVDRCFAAGAGSVIVEDFIAGKEWRVCVLDLEDGPLMMTPVVDYMLQPYEIRSFEQKLERDGADRIASKAKNQTLNFMQLSDLEPATRTALENVAFTTFRELGCRDIVVVDFRIDQLGRPWLLEVGLWGKLSAQSFEAISVRADGRNPDEVFRVMASNAIKRHVQKRSAGKSTGCAV